MSLIEKGNSKIAGGPSYKWVLEDAEDAECRLTVAIGEWALIRPHPTLLTSSEVAEQAAKIARVLVTLIKSAS